MKSCLIMILHYTHGWTQECLESLADNMPGKELVIFNNNPRPGQIVQKTRGFWGSDALVNRWCQREAKYARSHPYVTHFVEMPRSSEPDTVRLPFHGDVLDFAFRWCLEAGYDQLMHIEPDCKAHGTKWFRDMEAKIEEGNWVVGTGYMNRTGDYVMHLCPTYWEIKPVIGLIDDLKLTFNKYGPSINTGQKVMRECQKLGKATHIPDPDTFFHHNGGSGTLHSSMIVKQL